MTTLQATDRQEIWEPRWLVEVATSSYFEPRLFSTEDLPATTGFYHGRLMTHPTIERNFTDVFWGMTEVSRAVVQLDNADNTLDAIYTGDPRGKALILRRYDRQAGTVAVEFTGMIDDAVWSPGVIELSAVSPDLSVFEQIIPKGTVQAASGIAGSVDSTTAVDLGASVPVIYGNVTRHKLIYVSDDVVNDKYDYLVGVGDLTVSAVYRNGPADTLHAAAASEYSVLYGVYGDTTIVRFLHRQVDFQNGFYTLYADVTGLSSERNFVRAIRTLLSNTVYGLGQTINAASFDAAEAMLDPTTGTEVTGLYVDGIFTARPARDCLRDLLMIRGMRLDMNASGEWIIAVDTEQTVEKLLLQDGTGVGERTLLGIRNRRRPPTSEKTSNLILRFRPDPLDDSIRLEVRRGVNSTGVERIIEHPYIRDTTTADKVVYYLATREKFGLETVEVDAGQEGRSLSPGDLVRVTYAPMGYDASTMEVRRVRKGIDRVSLLLGSWTSDFYGYSAGSLPTEPTRPAPSGTLNPLKTIQDVEVFTGLSGISADLVAVVVDESDDEVDWIVSDGTDILWGETTYAGAVVTSLSVKIVAANPAQLSACWDPAGDIHVGWGVGATLKHARLSKDGFVESGPTTVTTASQTMRSPAVTYNKTNGKLFWVYVENPSGVPPTAIRIGRTDLAGTLELEVTAATFGSTVTVGGPVIAADSSGDVHAFFRDTVSARDVFYFRADTSCVLYASPVVWAFDRPLGLGTKVNDPLDPLALFIDADDVLHVFAYTETSKLLLYGRMDNRGRVLAPLTPCDSGATFGKGAGHALWNLVFVPKLATSTSLNQRRFTVVPQLGPLSGMFAGVAL